MAARPLRAGEAVLLHVHAGELADHLDLLAGGAGRPVRDPEQAVAILRREVLEHPPDLRLDGVRLRPSAARRGSTRGTCGRGACTRTRRPCSPSRPCRSPCPAPRPSGRGGGRRARTRARRGDPKTARPASRGPSRSFRGRTETVPPGGAGPQSKPGSDGATARPDPPAVRAASWAGPARIRSRSPVDPRPRPCRIRAGASPSERPPRRRMALRRGRGHPQGEPHETFVDGDRVDRPARRRARARAVRTEARAEPEPRQEAREGARADAEEVRGGVEQGRREDDGVAVHRGRGVDQPDGPPGARPGRGREALPRRARRRAEGLEVRAEGARRARARLELRARRQPDHDRRDEGPVGPEAPEVRRARGLGVREEGRPSGRCSRAARRTTSSRRRSRAWAARGSRRASRRSSRRSRGRTTRRRRTPSRRLRASGAETASTADDPGPRVPRAHPRRGSVLALAVALAMAAVVSRRSPPPRNAGAGA